MTEATAWQLARRAVLESPGTRLAELDMPLNSVIEVTLSVARALTDNMVGPAQLRAFTAEFVEHVADLPITTRGTSHRVPQDKYKKGMAESTVRGTVALVDTFLGIKKDKAGNVLEGTALRPEAYNAVLRDIEASGNTINATSVAQALQRIAQSNPGLVSVLPETGWTGMGDRTPQLRPQLRQQAGQKPAAQSPAAASGSVPRIKGEADYNALQPGQQYYDPKGVLRTKGGV
jgi:hypothetical protein